MMGDIIEFPTKATQEWAGIERTLREIFREAVAPKEMQDEVLAQMKEVFERYNVQFNVALELPGNLPKDQSAAVSSAVSSAFADYEKQLHDFMNRILLERLQIEIELYKLRHDGNDDT
jgi:hypothetical protein